MDWARFAQQMAAMARDLLAQESVDATLNRITGSATELVEGCDAAGILVLRGKEVQTLAPTHELVVDSDRLQERLSEGPCFDAAHTKGGERVFRIPDLTREQPRWPSFAPQAQQLGVGSMMGFMLYTEDEELGALNLYSRKPGVFTEVSELAGWLLASHAAVAFASARTHAQMAHAVATRHMIGEAMGILMGSHHLTEEQAFDTLRRHSQENNVKLREVARLICEHGNLA
ncbi:GAF and ANTAR domain-containing protein [Streptomyces viridochromogenes]|uniref:GAF and ANTAR domain-containing protein n=1 Tax=Streptomyces viridochromogenes TaxID=1938 RepID=UPI00069CD638|nr:GAF and ANTAR domain-containing protein [Streptomyces viridochromogenes]KOG11765.1 antitermination regulator [Streptomyces viridochromogenes]KOG24026.1 antitermination regulator [Streptomyces viridochromogenes]